MVITLFHTAAQISSWSGVEVEAARVTNLRRIAVGRGFARAASESRINGSIGLSH